MAESVQMGAIFMIVLVLTIVVVGGFAVMIAYLYRQHRRQRAHDAAVFLAGIPPPMVVTTMPVKGALVPPKDYADSKGDKEVLLPAYSEVVTMTPDGRFSTADAAAPYFGAPPDELEPIPYSERADASTMAYEDE